MDAAKTPEQSKVRTITCARCGAIFGCARSGDCWCADKSFRLPMPTGSEDCLCPDCLRAMARRQTVLPPS